ncbi:ABC transporter permease [Undibacterium arcticum]|uniref:ABC transporter permease n=1 Tax=Undibacterium arcticum TaxID=1762892 RepID=A0ABV7EUL7_9BURK
MKNIPDYVGWQGITARYVHFLFCGCILMFLVLPVLAVIPLSLNAEPYFNYPIQHFCLRWYEDMMTSPYWLLALKNTMTVGILATLIATVLGVLAALGLSHPNLPGKGWITALLLSPMIVPLVIAAVGMYFFYTKVGLAGNLTGLVLAHAALGTPFVVITVTATLVGYNDNLTRAARSLGANPFYAFWKIKLPMIAPGVVSGALFAFATSFDEVIVALFLSGVEQRTVPRQMWSGVREQLSPTILAVATVLVIFSILLLTTMELLRRRTERLRGIPRGD